MKVVLFNGRFQAAGPVPGSGAILQYGDPPANQDELSAYMDSALTNLKGAYYYAGLKIGLNPDNILKWYSAGLVDNAALSAVEKDYADIGKFINQLDTSLRQAVLTGANASGNPYGIDRWKSFAQDVASDIAAQTQYAWDSSVIATAPSSAVLALQKTAKEVGDPFGWPWYVWAGVAVAGVVAMGPVINFAAAIMKRRHQPA